MPKKTTVASAYEPACHRSVGKSQAMPRKEKAALATKIRKGSKSMQGSKGKSEEKGEEPADEVECWECFKKGHISRDSKDPATIGRKAAKDAARKSWKKNRGDECAEAAMEQEAEDIEYDEEIGAAMIGFPEDAMLTKSARVRSMYQMEVGFDTMCSLHVFGERRLISSITSCDPVTYKGIVGTIVANQAGEHNVLVSAYYCPGAPNLLSVGQVTSESSRANEIEVRISDGAFKVSKGNLSYLFENDGRSLFVTDLSYDVYGENCYMIETIMQNEQLYAKRQVEAARRVRLFASAMGAMADIIGQVRNRRVDGIDLTVEDVV